MKGQQKESRASEEGVKDSNPIKPKYATTKQVAAHNKLQKLLQKAQEWEKQQTKKKAIKIEIENKHLDALEDLLYSELSIKEEKEAREKVKQLWQLLVSAFEETEE